MDGSILNKIGDLVLYIGFSGEIQEAYIVGMTTLFYRVSAHKGDISDTILKKKSLIDALNKDRLPPKKGDIAYERFYNKE